MHLERCYASEPLVEAARDHADLRMVEEPTAVKSDGDGQFTAPSPE